jgi:hypothetical protein
MNFNDIEEPAKFVNIPIKRAFISKVCDYSKLDRVLEIIEEECSELDIPPIVNLKVSGGEFTKSDVIYDIEKCLLDKCLRLNIDLEPDSVLKLNKTTDSGKIGLSAVEDAMRDKLSDYDEELQDFAIDLHRSLVSRDKEAGLNLVDDYYENVISKKK